MTIEHGPRPVDLGPPLAARPDLVPPRLPYLRRPPEPRPSPLRPSGRPRPYRLRAPTGPPDPPVRRFTRPVPATLPRATGPVPVPRSHPAGTAPSTIRVRPGTAPVLTVDDPAASRTGTVVDRRTARRAARTAVTGSGRTDRVNRGVLTVTGLVLVAAGGAGLLLDGGTLQWTAPDRTYHRLAADAAGAVDVSAAVAMAVCLTAVVVGLRWALAQLRPVRHDGPRLTRITLPPTEHGETTLSPAVLSRAAGADLARLPGVASGRVRLHTLRPVPMALVVVELHLDADLTEVDAGLRRCLERLARTVDVAPIETEVRVRFARSPTPVGPRAR